MSDMVRTSEVATAVAAALLGAGAELEATRPEAEVEVPPLEGFRTQEETEAPRRKFDYGEHFGSMDHPEDFEPSKLLNNHIWAGELRRRLDETEPEVEIGYVYVTTPKGGSEYRPLARFDKLPSNPRHFVRRKSVKGTVFDAVCLEEESVAGESESTLPPRRLMPLDPKRSWGGIPVSRILSGEAAVSRVNDFTPCATASAETAIPEEAPSQEVTESAHEAPAAEPLERFCVFRDANPGVPVYKRAVVKRRKAHIELTDDEALSHIASGGELLIRVGEGKATRYQAL
jgi:hypothetical protein